MAADIGHQGILLIIDKIYMYIVKTVEYISGKVQGLIGDGNIASTLLCFMVKSLAGKYKDDVATYLIDRPTLQNDML